MFTARSHGFPGTGAHHGGHTPRVNPEADVRSVRWPEVDKAPETEQPAANAAKSEEQNPPKSTPARKPGVTPAGGWTNKDLTD